MPLDLTYRPPGPVCAQFIADRSSVSMIMGPVGSGKTVGALWKIVTISMEQEPSQIDGVRYSRWLVIRDTYENASKTVMLSWLNWFPKTAGKWIAGPPSEHILRFKHPSGDGTVVEMHVMFGGLGEHSVENLLRGKEITGAYINEADLTPEDLLTQLRRRVGRYPMARHARATWYGVICDMNAPDVESWPYRRFEEKRYPGHAIFYQPSGRSPQAENLENLPEGYYENQIAEAEADPDNLDVDWFVKRYVDSEYVFTRDGKPVFMQFKDTYHVARTYPRVVPMVPGLVGSDAGRSPAALLAQWPDNGPLIIHDEIILTNADAGDMAEAVNQRIARNWPEIKGWTGWGDPAAAKPTETSNKPWLTIVTNKTGFLHRPAPGENNLALRHAGTNRLLKETRGGQPAIIISPRCRMLRRAFNSGYQYKKRFVGGMAVYGDKPNKNEYSHVMDACMNLVLGGGGTAHALQRAASQAQAVSNLRSRVISGQERIGG